MDIVDGHRGTVGAEGGDGDIAQPDGFLDQRAGAIVFAEEVAGFFVGVKDGPVGPATDPDPLAEGVV